MFRRLPATRLARNSIYLCGSQLSLTLLQGSLFVVLSRALGPAEFGLVGGSLAIVAALMSFSGMGMGSVAVMRIARDQGHPGLYHGNAIAVISLTGLLGLALALVLASAFYADTRFALLVGVFGVSELLLTKYIDTTASVFYGMEEHGVGVLFLNLLVAARLALAVGLNLLVPAPEAMDWAVLHLGSGLVTAAVLFAVTWRRTGRPELHWATAWRDSLEGFFFALQFSGRSVSRDADKAVLARHVPLDMSGAYTAAYRVVFMAYSPVLALVMARQAHVYRAGRADGLAGSFRALQQVAAFGAAYGIVLAAGLYFGAELIPLLLGSSYALASDVVRAMCLLPLLFIAQSILSALLAGVDHQRLLACICVGTAVVSVGLNLILVPALAWKGSVAAAYASQAFLLVTLLAAVVRVRSGRRQPHGSSALRILARMVWARLPR